MAEKLCELQKKSGSSGGLPSSLINKTMQLTARGTVDSDVIINVSNVSSMKVWSYNTSQAYNAVVYNPSGAVVTNVSKTLAESSAITIDVSALDYVYIQCATANSSSTIAYQFLS